MQRMLTIDRISLQKQEETRHFFKEFEHGFTPDPGSTDVI